MKWQFYPAWRWLPWHTKLYDGDGFYYHFAGWGCWQFRWYTSS